MPLHQEDNSQLTYLHQDYFLSQLAKSQQPVYLYLQNGVKLNGHISGFDKYVIFLSDLPNTGDISQMVYKSSISTVLKASNRSSNK